jgi:tripartite ATP-independent transporter DctP family solute receptor
MSRRSFNRAAVATGLGAFISTGKIARAATTTLVMSHHLPTNHLVHRASERFAALVAEATKGQVAIDIKPNSSLFNLRSGAEALRLGSNDLHWADMATLGTWRPEFGFIALPFLFNGLDHVKRVLYGPVGEQAKADVKSTLGIEVLSLGTNGFRIFIGNKAIRTVDDCKGIKLRVPEIPVYVNMAKAIGANPTPIPADGMFTALQTHVVDAVESPPDYFVSIQLWEVAHNATRTNHIYSDFSLLANAKRIAGLPADIQAAIRGAAKQAVEVEMWAAYFTAQDDAWKTLAEKTQAVADPDRASFREKTRSVIDAFVAANAAAKKYVDGVNAAST